MNEEDVIKRRLIIDGEGTGDDRRLNVILKQLSKWINTSNATEQENLQMYDKILTQLCLAEHSRKRSEIISEITVKQNSKYNDLHNKYSDEMATTKQTIVKLKKALEEAKVVKQNQIQYDLLAENILKEPSTTETLEKLRILQAELRDLNQTRSKLEDELEKRQKQFNVIHTAAQTLRCLLTEGIGEEETDVNPGPEPMSE